MPSVSRKQHAFMAAVANSPAFASTVGVPIRVGRDFVAADKMAGKFLKPQRKPHHGKERNGR